MSLWLFFCLFVLFLLFLPFQFGGESAHLSPLNGYIAEAHQRFKWVRFFLKRHIFQKIKDLIPFEGI